MSQQGTLHDAPSIFGLYEEVVGIKGHISLRV